MNIHEYQAKKILKEYGVSVPRGIPAFSVDDAVKAAKSLEGKLWVVKAQIHAGGRGKAGGVKIAKSLGEVEQYATEILGKTLVTHQTGPDGQKVNRLYVEEGVDIARELYVAVVLDRANGKLAFMASEEGGVEIEEVAEHSPEKILTEIVEPLTGLTDFQCRNLAFGLGLRGAALKSGIKFMKGLYKAFVEKDCSLAEINPLVVTKNDEVL
ncbi:MAG: acetate--CoA ligase family protein, partial [Myxococcales bacterium]|nr:acetate--CoA ligase family protein [Myxococcales bacterium]